MTVVGLTSLFTILHLSLGLYDNKDGKITRNCILHDLTCENYLVSISNLFISGHFQFVFKSLQKYLNVPRITRSLLNIAPTKIIN